MAELVTDDLALPASRMLHTISICAGGGGLDLGLELAIRCARPACYVEIEAFAAAHLVAAMRAGRLHSAPVWSNARTFDGRPWRGLVDAVIGGIPCQPHSHAGRKQGSNDERDLWSPTRRIIVQARPWLVLIENVGGMLSAGDDEIAGAERVRRDLRKLGFTVEGGLFTASEVGASHDRERLFILAVHEGLADAVRGRAGAGGEPQAPHHDAGGARRRDAAEPRDVGLDMADANRDGHEGAQSPRSPASIGRRLGDGGDALADAGGAGLQGRELGGPHGCVDRGSASGSAPELCGARLVDAESVGWGEGRAEPAVRRGRPAAAGAGGGMGPVGDASGARGRPVPVFEGGQDEADADPDWTGFLFAPGPGERENWQAVLDRAPEFEPSFRRVADGLASRLDFARIDRLRMLGNGVVPLAAAYAIRSLATALASSSRAAAQLVRMIDE